MTGNLVTMSWQLAMLLTTAALAAVAVAAAVVALRAVRELRRLVPAESDVSPVQTGVSLAERQTQREPEPAPEVVRVVEGRVIVQPTQEQVVAATMTRPGIRLGILAAGVAHALRPESRDRIVALMRREFRGRRRARQRSARAAARATNGAPPNPHQGWVGS